MDMDWNNSLFLEAWEGLAQYYVSLPLFPVFNIVHYILTAAALRNETGGLQFAFKHPVASCVLTFIVAGAGGILMNLSLARSPLECVLNGWSVFSCIIVWYLIFFSPMDLCYLFTLFTPLKLILLIVEEFARAKKVFSGVAMAASVYPNSLLAMAVVGMFKGSGKRWGVTLYRLSYDPKSAGHHELLQISYVTKAAFLCGAVYAYNQMYLYFDPHSLVLLFGILFASIRLWLFFNSKVTDPFVVPQELSWKIMTIFSPIPRDLDQCHNVTPRERTSGTHVQVKKKSSKKQKSD